MTLELKIYYINIQNYCFLKRNFASAINPESHGGAEAND